MKRLLLPLLLAAATAVPAEAAAPYCAVVLRPTEPSAFCSVSHPGVNGLIRRTLTFQVSAGYVTGTVTCGSNTKSASVAAPFTGEVTVTQWRGDSCTSFLTAVVPLSAAAGVSTYTVVFV